MKFLISIRKAIVGYILVFIALPVLVKALTGVEVLSVMSGTVIVALATVFFSFLEGEENKHGN